MKYNKLYSPAYLLAVMFIILCTGCNEDKFVLSLNLSTNKLDFPSSGGNQMFTIECNAYYAEIGSDAPWLSWNWDYISSRAVEVTVTAAANTSATPRTATITISTIDDVKRTISVTQDGTLPIFNNGIVAASNFGGGDGSQNSPYLIADAKQLKRLADKVNNDHQNYANTFFKLMADIEVTANEWIPIGHSNAFRGDFDGNGHTIKGILQSNKFGYFGFFGQIVFGARISNLTIAATVINEFSESSASTGAIAGFISNSEITNCKTLASASISGGGYIGGIAGRVDLGNINDCINDAFITWKSNTYLVGGIAGNNRRYADGNNAGIINNCINNGVISGEYQATIGGIVGSNENYAIIIHCTNTNDVSNLYDGMTLVGGIAGENKGVIHTSLNTGNITGYEYYYYWSVGGIAGENRGDIYSCCTNLGTLYNLQGYTGWAEIGEGWQQLEPCPDGHTKR